jgi:hypothetical protein
MMIYMILYAHRKCEGMERESNMSESALFMPVESKKGEVDRPLTCAMHRKDRNYTNLSVNRACFSGILLVNKRSAAALTYTENTQLNLHERTQYPDPVSGPQRLSMKENPNKQWKLLNLKNACRSMDLQCKECLATFQKNKAKNGTIYSTCGITRLDKCPRYWMICLKIKSLNSVVGCDVDISIGNDFRD